MKILALEFSSRLRSVAIAEAADEGEATIRGYAEDADFRGVTGMMLIDRALIQAHSKPADISVIAVGLGPGSYTGIRSAIAIAQGWHLGREVKIIGISSTRCIAEEARLRDISGQIAVVVDAQRGEVYLQKWELDSSGAREIESLRIASPSVLPANQIVAGPEASKFHPGALDICPSARTLATLLNQGIACPAERLEPIYLRETTFVKAPPPRQIE